MVTVRPMWPRVPGEVSPGAVALVGDVVPVTVGWSWCS